MSSRLWVLRLFVVAAVALSGTGSGPLAVHTQAPTFKSGVEQVRLDVLVSSGGRPVHGLTADDFDILDNGIAQDPAIVTKADGASVLFVFDTSDSLSGVRFRELVDAAHTFTAQLGPADRIGLVTFDDAARLVVPLQQGPGGVSQVSEALDGLRTDGRTAMRDGIVAGLEALAGSVGGSLLVLFTDGEDNASTSALDDVVEAVKRSQAMIGVVAVGLNTDTSLPSGAILDAREHFLKLIGEANGGPFLRVEYGQRRLDEAFSRVLEDFSGRYVLSYTPHHVARDDGWHTLKVKVRKGRARTRAGYYAGTAPAFATTLRLVDPKAPNPATGVALGAPLPTYLPSADLPATAPVEAPLATAPTPPLGYAEVVDLYRKGRYNEAFSQIEQWWPVSRLEREDIAAALSDDAKVLASAVLLHTDVALREPAPQRAITHFLIAQGLVDRLKGRGFDAAFRRTWMLLAEAYLRARNDDHCVKLLTSLAYEFPADPEVLLALGSAHEFEPAATTANTTTAESSIGRAELDFRAALARDPSNVEARLRLGRVLVLLGRSDKAAAELQRVLTESQEPYFVYLAALFMGRLHENAGRLPQAAAFYRFALKVGPGAQSASLGLSQMTLMMGAPVAAVGPVVETVRAPELGTLPTVDPCLMHGRLTDTPWAVKEQGALSAGDHVSTIMKDLPAGGREVMGYDSELPAGGSAPHWRADGKELFYVARDRWVMAVNVTATDIFRAEAPQRLFQLPESASWDVHPDGQRFLLVVPAGKNTPPPFTVVLNWQAGLRK